MDKDEFDKLSKQIDDELNKRIMNAYGVPLSYFDPSTAQPPVYNYPPMTTRHRRGWTSTSPTDPSSCYEYQEPEKDEQGTYYGYKILWWDMRENCFYSPRYHSNWKNGELTSDVEPRENHMHGVHFTKRLDHPCLREYGIDEWTPMSYLGKDELRSCLVKCALSGTIVETSQGFRAQHAQIIGVLLDGYWTNYQDFERCATGYSRRNSYEERRFYPQDWNF